MDLAEGHGPTWLQRKKDTLIRRATCVHGRHRRTMRMVGARMCMTVGVDDMPRCREALSCCHQIVGPSELRRLCNRQMPQARQDDEHDDQQMVD